MHCPLRGFSMPACLPACLPPRLHAPRLHASMCLGKWRAFVCRAQHLGNSSCAHHPCVSRSILSLGWRIETSYSTTTPFSSKHSLPSGAGLNVPWHGAHVLVMWRTARNTKASASRRWGAKTLLACVSTDMSVPAVLVGSYKSRPLCSCQTPCYRCICLPRCG